MSTNDPAYILDLSSANAAESTDDRESVESRGREPRPWLAVYWKCCRTYSRLYRNPAGDAYHGYCPRCGTRTRAAIGPDGVSSRFFTAE